MAVQELLYRTFESELHRDDRGAQTFDEFVDVVVVSFEQNLKEAGWLYPFHLKNLIFEDFRQDITEMTQKKIYGYNSLTEYRESALAKSSSQNTSKSSAKK